MVGVKALVAPDGNVRFLAGFGNDVLLADIAPDGTVLWETVFASGGTDMALDAAANAYVTGSELIGSSFDWVTRKIDAAGVIVWTDVYDGPGGDYDVARAIGVTSAGDAFVTGTITSAASGRDMGTAMYDALGNRQWVAIYDGPGGGDDDGYAVSILPGGGCVATGAAFTGPWLLDDAVTIAYDASGARKWAELWDDGYGLNNVVEDIAVNAGGDVFITGKDPYDYFTVKYRDDLHADVEVLLTPDTQPLEIPASGGSFTYQAMLRNNTPQSKVVSVALFALLPNGGLFGPLAFYQNITLPAGKKTTFVNLSASVPGGAPAGEYAYGAAVLDGAAVADTTRFFFTKL